MRRFYEVIIPATMNEEISLEKIKEGVQHIRKLYPEFDIVVAFGYCRITSEKCPHCGKQCVDKNDNYCVMCGNTLKETAD